MPDSPNNAGRSAARPGFLRRWWFAGRPFSFPASAMPVILGTTAAVTVGGAAFNLFHFLLALGGMLLLHAAANMAADVQDFKRGLDREVFPVSGAVVRGWISTRAAAGGAALLAGAGCLIGCYLAAAVSWSILPIGALGVAAGAYYTVEPFALKYRGLGDLAVLLAFGLLGALGAWTVQTGAPAWTPVLWVLPIALLVVGILHANNWRDMRSDTACGCRTVASLIGDHNAEGYFALLLFLPYALVAAFALCSRLLPGAAVMPLGALLCFLSLPAALKLLARARRRNAPCAPLDFVALDGAVAQLSLLFGSLYIAGLLAGWMLPGMA